MQNEFESKYDFDICFLSILFPPENEKFVSNSKSFRAQNITAIQLSIIDGLAASNSNSPYLINTPLLALFPRGYKYPIVRQSKMAGEYNGVNHSFVNVPFLYSSSLFNGAKKHLKKWATNDNNKEKLIIAYALTRYTLKAMKYVKKLNPSIKTAIIVPDLPQYTYAPTKNAIRRLKNNIAIRAVKKSIRNTSSNVDLWLLFSEKMKECLPALNDHMVFEGIATDLFEKIENENSSDETKVVLYAGGMNQHYGVKLLLDSFELLKGNSFRLVLAGKGPMVSEIKKRAKENSRIEYLGEVPREKLLKLEKNASILINPRINSGIFTRYSFPSKNMEYLSSGTPMIGFKLDGIPDEYDAFINYFDGDDAQSLANTITRVANDELATQKAKAAREYVLNFKNKYFWGKEILNKISK